MAVGHFIKKLRNSFSLRYPFRKFRLADHAHQERAKTLQLHDCLIAHFLGFGAVAS